MTSAPMDRIRGKSFWRVIDSAASNVTTTFVSLRWVATRVERATPIIDFCWRNEIELHSFDWELHVTSEVTVGPEVFPRLGLSADLIPNMVYFRLNGLAALFS